MCILCQKHTDENLVCPQTNPVVSQREAAYSEIVSLSNQFKAISADPHPNVELPCEESMLKKRASWHKSCRQRYRASALEQAKKNYHDENPPTKKKSRRSHEEFNRNLCIFCAENTNSTDHSFQKVALTQQIRDKAVMMGEERIVAILSEGDLVAIEAKYHRDCYIR